jgi:hypothetical protein
MTPLDGAETSARARAYRAEIQPRAADAAGPNELTADNPNAARARAGEREGAAFARRVAPLRPEVLGVELADRTRRTPVAWVWVALGPTQIPLGVTCFRRGLAVRWPAIEDGGPQVKVPRRLAAATEAAALEAVRGDAAVWRALGQWRTRRYSAGG